MKQFIYDVDIHNVNRWDTYQVEADCLSNARYNAVTRVINETGKENAETIDCIKIYRHCTDKLLMEYNV